MSVLITNPDLCKDALQKALAEHRLTNLQEISTALLHLQRWLGVIAGERSFHQVTHKKNRNTIAWQASFCLVKSMPLMKSITDKANYIIKNSHREQLASFTKCTYLCFYKLTAEKNLLNLKTSSASPPVPTQNCVSDSQLLAANKMKDD